MKKELVKLAKEKGLTIGSIESMTGGLFASEITSVPGASKVFKGTVVTYATEEKINVVGVSRETVDKFSVVSKEVAVEMATKGRELLNVDICISVTGNAGPTTEPGGKPVGEVHLAIASKDKIVPYMLRLDGTRNQIRKMTVDCMFQFLIQFIEL